MHRSGLEPLDPLASLCGKETCWHMALSSLPLWSFLVRINLYSAGRSMVRADRALRYRVYSAVRFSVFGQLSIFRLETCIREKRQEGRSSSSIWKPLPETRVLCLGSSITGFNRPKFIG